MKKPMSGKKLLSLCLALVLVLALLPGEASAAGITWNVSSDGYTLTISGTGDMPDYSPSNPAPWVKTNQSSQIKNVIFANDSVTNIGDYAFYNCTNLGFLQLPSGLTRIGSHAIFGCSRLDESQFSGKLNNVHSIGSYAFENCTSLKGFSFPSEVIVISEGLFKGCTNLSSIGLPSGAISIGNEAFRGCRGLSSIEIPSTVTSIGSGAFRDCGKLDPINGVVVPSGVTVLNDYTFSGCSGMKKVTLPAGITAIGNSAFLDCSSLLQLTVPNGVKTIGISAFDGCASLEELSLPAGVTQIGSDAFANCTSLKTVTIPEGVTEIPANAFFNDSSLESISLPASLTKIGFSAFSGCGKLTKVVYAGKREDWKKIDIAEGNLPLANVTLNAGDDPLPATIPVMVSAEATPGKVTVTWEGVANATSYTVMRRQKKSSGWTAWQNLFTTARLQYVDESVTGGTVYCYTVKADTSSEYDTVGLQATGIAVIPLKIKSVSADKTSARPGDTITWSVSAQGNEDTIVYLFHVFKEGTTSKIAQSNNGTYTAQASFSYTPAAEGTYYVKVFVKYSNATQGLKTTGGSVTVSTTAPTLAISSVKADKASAAAGEKITWTATAAGGSGALQYYFIVYKDGVKVKTRSYSTAKTFSYTPTEAGSYKAKVYVKDTAGTKVNKTSSAVTVTAAGPKISSVKAGVTSAYAGDKITWTATASGGSGTLQYYFNLYKDGVRIKTRAYSTANTFSYTPTESGTYKVRVYVKDAAENKVNKLSAAVTVTLGPPAVISVKAGKTSAAAGEKITWTAVAVGSEQPLQYFFVLYKDGTRIKTRSYSTTKTFSYTPTEAGTYRVKVYVKDASGAKVCKLSARITVS